MRLNQKDEENVYLSYIWTKNNKNKKYTMTFWSISGCFQEQINTLLFANTQSSQSLLLFITFYLESLPRALILYSVLNFIFEHLTGECDPYSSWFFLKELQFCMKGFWILKLCMKSFKVTIIHCSLASCRTHSSSGFKAKYTYIIF